MNESIGNIKKRKLKKNALNLSNLSENSNIRNPVDVPKFDFEFLNNLNESELHEDNNNNNNNKNSNSMKISSKFKTKVPKLNLKKQGNNIDARSDTLFCPDNENNNDNSCIDVKNVNFSESLANKLNKDESNQN